MPKIETAIIIKKYANRRLYDTSKSTYITLEDLRETINEGLDFIVQDAKTGEDLTHSVLTQIIVEQESKGKNLLPIRFLKQLVGFYDHDTQSLLPHYLETAIDKFTENQEVLRETLKGQVGTIRKSVEDVLSITPPSIQELTQKNFEIFEQTMNVFNPFRLGGFGGASDTSTSKANTAKSREDRISTLQKTIREMQDEINALNEGRLK
jgi:polyhydroxyalkanoate synthesis repressor PhaR